MPAESNQQARDRSRDADRVAAHEKQIERKLETKGAFKALLANARLLLSLVLDYAKGRYRTIPYAAIGSAAFALLYVLSPVDLIPDFIPGVGYLDDAAVLAFCLKLLDVELNRYRAWKQSRDIEVEATVI